MEAGCYYLVQEKEDAGISLIKINVESDQCVFVSKYEEIEVQEWKKKSDSIHDIIEKNGKRSLTTARMLIMKRTKSNLLSLLYVIVSAGVLSFSILLVLQLVRCFFYRDGHCTGSSAVPGYLT